MWHSSKIAIIAAVFLILPCARSYSAQAEATLEITPQTIALGKAAVATVKIRTITDIKQITFPPVENISIQRSGVEQHTVFNGNVSERSLHIKYRIIPSGMGAYTIGPASVNTGSGEEIKTNSVHLDVVQEVAQQPDLRIELTPDPERDLYVNEPLLVTWQLVSLKRISGLQVNAPWLVETHNDITWSDPDDLRTAYSQGARTDIATFKIGNEDIFARYNSVDTGNGREYVIKIRRIYMPIKPGDYDFSPDTALAVVYSGTSNDMFFDADDPFSVMGAKRSEVSTVGKSLKFKVKPLPLEGRPASFSGAVGNFTMAASLKPDIVQAGETVTLTINISGHGSLDLIGAPAFGPCDGCQVLTPEIEANVNPFAAGNETPYKIFRFPIYMSKPGRQKLPAFEISYFDPVKAAYVTLASPDMFVEVKPASSQSSLNATFVPGNPSSSKGVADLGRDIMDIATDVRSLRNDSSALTGWGFGLFLAFPPVLFIALGLYLRARRNALLDSCAIRRKSAHAGFKRELARGMKPETVFRRYLSDLSGGLKAGEITPSEASEIVAECTYVGPSREAAVLLEELDAARFSLNTASSADFNTRVTELVERIESCRK